MNIETASFFQIFFQIVNIILILMFVIAIPYVFIQTIKIFKKISEYIDFQMNRK